ncbi:hypothetical protein [Terriglobus sp.]|uniref:hypothetical protein n=1 Tax=Terriglobus sp. TaxID=1889013 RepID=UPI003B0090E9
MSMRFLAPFGAFVLGGMLAGNTAFAQVNDAPAPSQKPEDKITVTQPAAKADTSDEAGRRVLEQMKAALGDQKRMQRQDYRMEGRTSTFFQNNPTGSTEYVLYHHPLAGSTFEDRIELTKKRDIVQIWTPTEGYELTFKGRKDLPKEDREAYFRRQQYNLDALVTTWVNDRNALVVYSGRNLVARRQADTVTIINAQNESVTIDVETETHLPIRRTFKVRNPKYKDFDEDSEEYSDWHSESGTPVPYATTRYLNGDTVSQRFVTKIQFEPVDPALFNSAKIGKHK